MTKILLLFVFILSFIGGYGQSTREIENKLIGIWGVYKLNSSDVKGELIIDLRNNNGEARISGFTVPLYIKGTGLSFNLPDERGAFGGYFEKSSNKITGHWIQDGMLASPVELALIEKNVYRGIVNPLEGRTIFYLSIQRINDSLKAFFRNPTWNFLRLRTFDVKLTKDSVILFDKRDQIHCFFDSNSGALYIPIQDDYSPEKFTRKNDSTAIGFYASVPFLKSKYKYKKPVPDNDGWQTGTLSEVGLDEKQIAEFINQIRSQTPSIKNPLNIHSLLIVRHGKLVLEEYFYGNTREQTHNLRSASKTYAPFMLGVAQYQGYKFNIDSPVHSLFPEYKPFANPDERKYKITLRNLMTMTSGLDSRGKYSEDEMYDQKEQPDWYKFTWDMPMKTEPGGDSSYYSSADINLVAGALTKITGEWIPDFFYKNFARPLQVKSYYMNLMPTGEGFMGGGLEIRSRDLIKLGQVYLSGGKWNGKQIISKKWVDESTAVSTHFRPMFDKDAGHDYGFGWHVKDRLVNGKTYRIYMMGGNGGQMTIVIPALDMVIGFTGGDYGETKKFFLWEIDYVPKYLIPAAVK